MKIAVIGSGISGLSSAYFLSKKYKVDLYEKEDHFGGHSLTYEIKEGDKIDNPLKNAPHTYVELASSEWKHAYSREEAAFPTEYVKNNKYWAPVARVDNVFGDRNLVCSCPSMDEYKDEAA